MTEGFTNDSKDGGIVQDDGNEGCDALVLPGGIAARAVKRVDEDANTRGI